MTLAFLPLAIACLAMFYVMISDASRMRISNRVSLILLASCMAAAALSAPTLSIFALHLLSGGAMLLFGFLLFAVGGFGAGDAKMLSAIAILFLPMELVKLLIFITIYGGVLGVLIIWFRAQVPVKVATHPLVASLFNHPKNMPYGIAISAAVLTIIPSSELVLRLVG